MGSDGAEWSPRLHSPSLVGGDDPLLSGFLAGRQTPLSGSTREICAYAVIVLCASWGDVFVHMHVSVRRLGCSESKGARAFYIWFIHYFVPFELGTGSLFFNQSAMIQRTIMSTGNSHEVKMSVILSL